MSLLRPDPSSLRSGDLVWPRADNQIVYYLQQEAADRLWTAQRNAFLKDVQADPQAADEDRALARQVRGWGYTDFASFPPAGAPMQVAFDRPWVGHIAIVDVRDGVPWVVDATPNRRLHGVAGPSGVADQTYADFLADDAHLQSHVWHGRLRGRTPAEAARIVAPALAQKGKPYQFFNFNLDDTAGFYCSKLIWYAVWESLALSLDGGSPARNFWVSPLQLMRSGRVDMLYVPPGRDYGA